MHRAPALSFGFANHFKVGYRHQPAGGRDQRVACLVPVGVVFPADHVKEVAFVETEFLRVARLWFIVVECFDYLAGQ